jgi:hypothetical protein
MAYDPGKVTVSTLTGATMVGWTFRLGAYSRLGQTSNDRTDVKVSAITMTDGYAVGQNGELSIDPMTGTASMSERFRPGVSDDVIDRVDTPLQPDDRIEIAYGQSIVQQGAITSVDTRMEAAGAYWIRKAEYSFSGTAGIMLANTASWANLPEEGALNRLRRFFTVNTNLLTAPMTAYLNATLMPGKNAGSSPYLELARDFTLYTRFPLRVSTVPDRWREVQVVPAVTFQGAPPAAVITDAEQWASSADFTKAVGGVQRPVAVDVIKNFDEFISGIHTIPERGNPLGSFRLGSSRLGDNLSTPVGIQVPAVIDVFGTRLVTAKIVHNFTSESYRSGLELVEPAKVG